MYMLLPHGDSRRNYIMITTSRYYQKDAIAKQDPKVYSANLRRLMSGGTDRGRVTAKKLYTDLKIAKSSMTHYLSRTNPRVPRPAIQSKIAGYFGVTVQDMWTIPTEYELPFSAEPQDMPIYDSFRRGVPGRPIGTFATYADGQFAYVAEHDLGYGFVAKDMVIMQSRYSIGDLCLIDSDDGTFAARVTFEKGRYVYTAEDGVRDGTFIIGRIIELRRTIR